MNLERSSDTTTGRPYEEPVVRDLGTVAEVTRGANAAAADGGSIST